MLQQSPQTLDVDDIMRRVREELARRKQNNTGAAASIGPQPIPSTRPGALPNPAVQGSMVPSQSPSPLPQSNRYSLNDLLSFHDRDFIRQAYLAVLRRSPDSSGEAHFLTKLRSGELSKVDVIGRLRFSPEGRSKAIRVSGLLVPLLVSQLSRVPVLGFVVRLAVHALRLPVIVKNIQQFEAHSAAMHSLLADTLNLRNSEINVALEQLAKHQREVSNRIGAVEEAGDEQKQRVDSLGRDLQSLGRDVQSLLSSASRIEALDAAIQQMSARAASIVQSVELGKEQAAQHGKQLSEQSAAVGDLRAASEAHQQQIASLEIALREHQARAASELEKQISSLVISLREQQASTASALAELASQAKLMASRLSETAERTDAQRAVDEEQQRQIMLLQRRFQEQRTELFDAQKRVSLLLEEARKRLPEPFDQRQIERMAEQQDHVLDAFYVSLEDQFRGTREDIKQRAAYYLPLIREAGLGTSDTPVLDLGCGRGEWLELLSEQGMTCSGIDLNSVMIQQCLERGLPASESEAFAYLAGLKANSLGAVTAIHLVEHLAFPNLVALFDEALRVLKPGGLVIFETPNPENVEVGSHYFYMDPTHRNPLPPTLLRFVAEARGFVDVGVHRLTENRGSKLAALGDVADSDQDARNLLLRVERLLSAPLDYAIIGRKA